MTFEFEHSQTCSTITVDSPSELVNGDGGQPRQVVEKIVSQVQEPKPVIFEFVQSESIALTTDAEPKEKPKVGPEAYAEAMCKWEINRDQITLSYNSQITALEREQTEAAIEMKSRQDAFKIASATHKAALTALCDLKQQGPTLPKQPNPDDFDPAKIVEKNGVAVAEKISAAKQVVASDGWRQIATSSFINKSIKGLGRKKIDAICESFETLGKLEDARTEAYKDHQHFSKVLPEGIGIKVGDIIENAMMDQIVNWMQSNQETKDSPAETQSSANTSPPNPAEATGKDSAKPSQNDSGDVLESDPPSDPDQHAKAVVLTSGSEIDV